MNKKLILSLVGISVVALAGVGAGGSDDQLDAATKARLNQFDSGPATVDVSKYPQGIQDDYQVFAQKCSQCHKLSRPINSDYALPDEWSRYVKRMMYKPGSGISSSDAKKIYDFLVYDSSVRKKAMWDEKVAKLAPADQTATQAKLKKVLDTYNN